MSVYLLVVERKEHSVLFENIKRRNSNQKCSFYQCTIYYNGCEMTRLCTWSGLLHFIKEKQNGEKSISG